MPSTVEDLRKNAIHIVDKHSEMNMLLRMLAKRFNVTFDVIRQEVIDEAVNVDR